MLASPRSVGWSTGLLAVLVALADPAGIAQEQGTRTAGMEKVRIVAEAEVLAVSCGLRLNEQLRNTLLTEALVLIDQAAFDSMEQFART